MNTQPSLPRNDEEPEWMSVNQPLVEGMQIQLLADYRNFKRGQVFKVLDSRGYFPIKVVVVENPDKTSAHVITLPRHLTAVIQQRLSDITLDARYELEVGTDVRLLRADGELPAGTVGKIAPLYPHLDLRPTKNEIPVSFDPRQPQKVTLVPFTKLAIIRLRN